MKIKLNQNLYKNMLIALASLIICIGTLSYFIGFSISVKSMLFYVIFLISTITLFFIIFLIIDKINKTYLIFDEEKIMEISQTDKKILVYYNQILYTKYHNKIDLFFCSIDFGYVEIVYKENPKDKEPVADGTSTAPQV